MEEKEPHWMKALEAVMQSRWPGSRLLSARPLQGGSSAQMVALVLQQNDGRKEHLVFRQPPAQVLQHDPHASSREFQLLSWLHEQGLTVPEPRFLLSSVEQAASSFLILEYLEGQPDYGPVLKDHAVGQMARFLSRLHGLRLPQELAPSLPAEAPGLFGPASWRPEYRDPALLAHRIEECLARLWPVPCLNQPALLHGDFWPGNLLWGSFPQRDFLVSPSATAGECLFKHTETESTESERARSSAGKEGPGNLIGVIDWEDARFGDPLMDLAICRLELCCFFGWQTAQACTSQYLARSPVNCTWLCAWDLWAAFRLLRLAREDFGQWSAFFPGIGRDDLTEGLLRERFLVFTSQAWNALEEKGNSVQRGAVR